MGRRELSAADIYCKFAAQLDEDGFRLYHAAQRLTGFQPYDAFPAALRMLKDHPQLKQVYLCLDHDSAGIEGAYRIADSIHSLGEYQVYRLFPEHKDWDEDLKARMGKDAIPAGEHPKLAYIAEKTAELKEMCLEDTDEYIKYKRMPADLFDDTMRKLERLKKQIIASDLTEKKESCATEMAKTAVAFCILRSRQIGDHAVFGNADGLKLVDDLQLVTDG